MNTTESNKLIAEFMSVRYKSDKDYFKELVEMREDGILYELGYMESQLKYHESWNWLIPVVQKIKKCKHYYQNLDGLDYALLCCLTIDSLYIEVVECIKEYNELNN